MLTLLLIGIAVGIISKLMTYKPKQYVPQISETPSSYRMYANGQEHDVCCPNCHRAL